MAKDKKKKKEDRGKSGQNSSLVQGPPMPVVHFCVVSQGCSCCLGAPSCRQMQSPLRYTGWRQGTTLHFHQAVARGGPAWSLFLLLLGVSGRANGNQPRMRPLPVPRSPKQRSNGALADTPLSNTRIPSAAARTCFISIHKLNLCGRLSSFRLEGQISWAYCPHSGSPTSFWATAVPSDFIYAYTGGYGLSQRSQLCRNGAHSISLDRQFHG